MLDVFRDINNFDTIFFVPNVESDDEDEVKIEIAEYREKGEKIGGTELGDLFDIIVFRLDNDCRLVDLDKFEGILIEPREYVSRMIKENWYGMVTRKTTNSNQLVDSIFAKWSSI